MWANLVHLLPAIRVLGRCETLEEFKMEGDLLSELDRLLASTQCNEKLKLEKTGLKCKINAIYPKGTNLWVIFDKVIEHYHLLATITAQKDDVVTLSLKEGAAWKH